MIKPENAEPIAYEITKINAKEHHGTWTRNLVLTSDAGVPVRVHLSSDKNGELEIMPSDVHDPSNHWVWKIDLDELVTKIDSSHE
jgi:hypothetical protein